MNTTITRAPEPHSSHGEVAAHLCRFKFRTLGIPWVRDGVVIGCDAPISPEAIRETFRLVSNQRFSLVPVVDEVVRAILIRDGLIKRLAAHVIADIIITKVKPFMSTTEVLQIDLEVETLLEAAM